jgi:hypothetical protein
MLRHHEIHGNSGTGVVAEGIIFDTGDGAFTWLTPHKTVTVFDSIRTIKALHSHGDMTEIVIEGTRGKVELFDQCKADAALKKQKMREEKKK